MTIIEEFLANPQHIYLDTIHETVAIELFGYSISYSNRTPIKFCIQISLKEALDKRITKQDFFKGCQTWRHGEIYSNNIKVDFSKKYTEKDFRKMVLN